MMTPDVSFVRTLPTLFVQNFARGWIAAVVEDFARIGTARLRWLRKGKDFEARLVKHQKMLDDVENLVSLLYSQHTIYILSMVGIEHESFIEMMFAYLAGTHDELLRRDN